MAASRKTILLSLLDGYEETERLVIHDTLACNGRALLKFGACQLAKRCDLVHVFLFEMEEGEWLNGVPSQAKLKMSVHDFTSVWMEEGKKIADLSNIYNASSGSVAEGGPPSGSVAEGGTPSGSVAYVIDSLSFLLLHQSTHNICRWLTADLGAPSISLLHSDLHVEGTLPQIQYISTSTLQIRKTEESKGTNYEGIVHIIHKKSSGKIIKQTESYSIGQDYTSIITTTQDYSGHTKTHANNTPQIDPAANLTFDLHLSAREKEARSQVILPYTTAQLGLVGMATRGSGNIFYEPDAIDGFDESDPDDDLDF